MYKLSIYLNDDQYEKLNVLRDNSDASETEEYANELFYDALLARWLMHRGKQIEEYIKSDEFWTDDEDEEIYPTEFERNDVYCDGDIAVIEGVNVQLIEGVLHYVIAVSGRSDRIPCEKEDAERFNNILAENGQSLHDYTWEELNAPIAGACE